MTKIYEPINWEDGTLVRPAKADLETGVVTPAIYEGSTPATAERLNHMDNGIKELYDNISLVHLNIIGGILPTNTYTKFGLIDSVLVGNKLEVVDNGIKVKSGVSHIKISGNISFADDTNGNTVKARHIGIFKNNSMIKEYWYRSTPYAAANYQSYSMAPIIFEVVENDYFEIKFLSSGDTERIQGTNTNVLFEVID